MKSHHLASALAVFAFANVSSLTAQCATQWEPGGGFAGVYGRVYALESWDPDGAGPQPPRLVTGGDFAFAGSVATRGIAAVGPPSGAWSAFGSGMDRSVRALLTLPNGDLVAGGDFTVAGGVACNCIARWDGASWSSLGTGISDSSFNPLVRSLALLPNGDLVAGGDFTNAGGADCYRIARWDGSAWHALGSGMNGSVAALAVLPNGDLLAGGSFTTAGGVACSRIARWDGTVWSPFGGIGNAGALQVSSMKVLPNGDLLIGGNFQTAGGVACNRIARWDGTTWSPLGTGTNGHVNALTALPNGDIVAGGDFTVAGGFSCQKVARWNGTAWSQFGSGTDNSVLSLAVLANGDLVAGGLLGSAGGKPCNGVARWNGASWSSIATGFTDYPTGPDDYPRSVVGLPDGDLIAGGTFVSADGLVCHGVARWDGTAVSSLGSGLNSNVSTLVVLPDGDVVAGGQFTQSGAVVCNRIARWDGQTWSPLGSGMGFGWVYSVAVLPNGDIVAAGFFSTAGGVECNRIARWDGAAWSPLGSGADGNVYCLAVLPDGDLVAGGQFTQAGGVACNRIARWDGTVWSPMGSGMDGTVRALVVLPNGDLVAGGNFAVAGGVACSRIARWDGANWAPLGAGMASSASWVASVNALAVLPTGDLVAGGQFTHAGRVACNHIARWDGAWSALGDGVSGYPTSLTHNPPHVDALAVLASGDVAAGGLFTHAGDATSVYVARWATSCPANVETLPTQCVGPAGPLTLTADVSPFAGSLYRSTTSGFADNALGFTILGWHPPVLWIPVLSDFDCRVIAWPLIVDLLCATNGVAEWQLELPVSDAIAGLEIYQQSLHLSLPLSWHSLSNSNTLKLTIGSY